MSEELITIATDAVLKQSSKSFCAYSKPIHGYTFEDASGSLKFDLEEVISAYETTGFGATQLAKAINVVNEMIKERMAAFEPDVKIEDEFIRPKTACSIFLATPNIAADATREHIRLLVKYKAVDCIVTSKVGIEQDLIKSLNLNRDEELSSICSIKSLWTDLLKEQAVWLPSQLIERIGLKVNHPDAICYWAAVNKIPIFCPSLDFESQDFVLDLIGDIRRINTFAHNTASLKTGVIVLGGGIPKHHTMNANLMRNGADYAVYMNSAPEFDGSDSGANPDEAISWGKIRAGAQVIKVTGSEKEAFPRLVERTFLNHIKLDHISDRPQIDIAKQFKPEFHEPGLNRMTTMSAVEIINEMLDKRTFESHPSMDVEDKSICTKSGCSIFLAYTSNMGSSGVRENIRFLVKYNLVDCIVATAGGIEEDLIKCLELEPELYANTYVGDFSQWPGSVLRENGINRIGNLYVPNDNYCRFEDWLMPILDKMLNEKKIWTPSELVKRLGLEINHPNSICYWAAKNNIPIFCPALTDGSLGDMLYFHSFRSPGLVLNPNWDRIRIDSFTKNTENLNAGVIILGGGAIEEYLMEAMKLRGGIDYGVFINTAAEFNKSGSNAKLDMLMYQGKLRPDAKIIELTRCASFLFSELVGLTFFNFLKNKSKEVSKR